MPSAEPSTITITAPSLGGVKITGKCTTGATTEFRGLKFASVEKRYEYPTPVDSYASDYDATEFGPIPPQPPQVFSPGIPEDQRPPPRPRMDEFECLNLCIMRPTVVENPIPVMIWIFPGGNMTGCASDKTYDPTVLVTRSSELGKPIMFVRLNYRLSLIGFVKIDGRANQGMYDQLEGIRWVKKHIADFGGDPENITVLGESAGSLATHYHGINEISKGLFKRLGMMSTFVEARTPRPLSEADEIVRKAKEVTGTTTDEEFKQVSVDALMKAVPIIGGMYGPVDDGDFLGNGPFIDKPLIDDVAEVMLGNCRFEAIFYAPKIKALVPLDQMHPRLAAVEKVGDMLVDYYGITPEGSQENFDKHIVLYDDISYGQPMHNTVNSLRERRQQKVYSYLFDEPNPYIPSLDAHHGVDVFYFFNAYKFDPKYDGFIEKYQTGWINFANGLPPWGFLAADHEVDKVVMLDQDIHEMAEGEYEQRRHVDTFNKLNEHRGQFDSYGLTRRYLM
ncbi:Alpha/Beta hydrolase protein [Lipomyces arxii]|uniref:Alpha/Beta hydrolase protein n=1 Tax=Lipomyces arxii TaxID=56418 RepID=UPI0034CD47E5